MKTDEDAVSQYRELANALQVMQADWILEEVEQVIDRGKVVRFGNLGGGLAKPISG